MEQAIAQLREWLMEQQAGLIQDRRTLVGLLESAWPHLLGSCDTRMTSAKLERLENPKWSAPVLTFVVERHGAAQFGSSRAELQGWSIDANAGSALSFKQSTRQIRPRSAPYDAKRVAAELAAAITEGRPHPHVELSEDGFQIRIATILPSGGPKEALHARRKRLRTALIDQLSEIDYTDKSNWRFARRT